MLQMKRQCTQREQIDRGNPRRREAADLVVVRIAVNKLITRRSDGEIGDVEHNEQSNDDA